MSALIPDLTATTLFPSFKDCPIENQSVADTTSSSLITYLLGTIQLEATLSTSPTYICKDRAGSQFAVTVRLPPDEIKNDVRGGGFDVAAWRRGWCVAIPTPQRSGVEGGKQGYVAVNKDDALIFPASLEYLINLSQAYNSQNSWDQENRACRNCLAKGSSQQLKICRGCEVVWYCKKECQIQDWNEKSHKKECKILKALKRLCHTHDSYSR